jgi:hypothetical protein
MREPAPIVRGAGPRAFGHAPPRDARPLGGQAPAAGTLSKEVFAPNAVFTAANGGPFVGTLDMNTGVVTPIVKGLGNPGGMVFVDTSPSAGEQEGIRQQIRARVTDCGGAV